MKRARISVLGVVLSLIAALLITLTSVSATTAEPAPPWWEPINRPAPDSQINVTGAPFKGTDANGKVRGFVDGHNHLMTNEAFGGKLVCGKPFSTKGVADALKDCKEHYPNGQGALLEGLTVDPDFRHDPVGWPTFKDWPNHKTMSHQQNYYAWLERAWRGGQRVLVTDLTSNGVICSIYMRDRDCDEMKSIRLQADKTYEMQDFIDNMYGGPGKGWFRIVKSAKQATNVIKSGKLAVVLGVETSEPFGCKQILDVAQCSKADIDRGLDELKAIGVRSMFLCHKFDNALCGVRFDGGTQGTIINVGQFLSTGTFWKTEKCRTPYSDNPIGNAPVPQAEDKLPGTVDVPNYPSGARCNVRGLTPLGEYALNGLMDRKMMVEIDHMGVEAAERALDIMESVGYPGVISSHSWMDTGWTERVYKLGGFISSYEMDSDSFAGEAAAASELRRKYDVGIGFGSDFNGLGSHPSPRGKDAPNKVTYPFRSYKGGPKVDRQQTGQRVWDFNTDGGAHIGMVPDWIEDVRRVAGPALVQDMLKGAQSYLDTWQSSLSWRRPVNLSRGGVATASSVENNIFKNLRPERARDGSVSTRWASKWHSDNQWWQLDLRSAQPVGRVVLRWEWAFAKEYRIQTSLDGKTWTTRATKVDGRGEVETSSFTPVKTRYVRVQADKRGTKYGYSLWEAEVYSK